MRCGMSKDSEAKTRVLHRRPSAPGPAAESAGSGVAPVAFECPNGHRIVVAASLAGKRGKCSKCGVAVEIPLPNAAVDAGPAPPPSAAERLPALDEAGNFPPGPSSAKQGESGSETTARPENWDFIGEPSGVADWPAESGSGQGVDLGHPTAALVARLWAERAHGGIIELHLANGSVLLPEWYDANWSRGTHGLFASQAADGSVTLTAVAWDTVQKVVVRKLTTVPDDMFV